jgi:FAD/FMN-containing dehydrogenase
MQDMTFHDDFKPKGCKSYLGTSVVTAEAGTQMGKIYMEADKYKKTLVGGMDVGVSFGGYLTAGGHSPLSTTYGLGADQAVEAELVTSSGDILTVNECQNSDLFWAIRGVSKI